MPVQAPQWTEFLSCPICCHEFDATNRPPISLACSHTVCKQCLGNLHRKQCPFDQTSITLDVDVLPINGALLSLIGASPPPVVPPLPDFTEEEQQVYESSRKCVEQLAAYLKPLPGSSITTLASNGEASVESGGEGTPLKGGAALSTSQSISSASSTLSRPMQRKLVTLINCQLAEAEGRARAMRAARSLGERTVTELILQHQNSQQLSANLWAAVRARGCQFLGPAMQEEVLKLVLLALEDGSALSRKVLVMFIVQRLEPHFPQASKTSIGHVVQLLYRASCFKVSKREGDSSLMQLKEEFRTYEALRREHDAQIVQIATEAGLRIAPDQWSSLLYGDSSHKSHMQSIIDKLQTPASFAQSVQELVIALQRTGDPGNLSVLRVDFEKLAAIDPSPDTPPPSWQMLLETLQAVCSVVKGLVEFISQHGVIRRTLEGTHQHHSHTAKYKTSMCRDLVQRGSCPRGNACTFAHSEEELERFRARSRKASTCVKVPSSMAQKLGTHPFGLGEKRLPHEPLYFGHASSLPKHHIDAMLARNLYMGNLMNQRLSGAAAAAALNQATHLSLSTSAPLSMAELPIYNAASHVYGAGLYTNPYSAVHPDVLSSFSHMHLATANAACHTGNARGLITSSAPSTSHASTLGIVCSSTEHDSAVNKKTIGESLDRRNSGINIITAPMSVATRSLAALQHRREEILIQLRKMAGSAADTLSLEMSGGNGYEPGPPVKTSVQSATRSHPQLSSSASLPSFSDIDFGGFLDSSASSASMSSLTSAVTSQEPLTSSPPSSSSASLVPSTSQSLTVRASASSPACATPSTATISTFPTCLYFSDHTGYRSYSDDPEDEFIPFGPPIVSRFGPISRSIRPGYHIGNPVQVSASMAGCHTVPTPVVQQPLIAVKPIPSLTSESNFEVPVGTRIPMTCTTNLYPIAGNLITVGHGMVDPPHLHMAHLDPLGFRPSDPSPLLNLRDNSLLIESERMRMEIQQLEKRVRNLQLQSEGERLTQELKAIEAGIREKQKELEDGRSHFQLDKAPVVEEEYDEHYKEMEEQWLKELDETERCCWSDDETSQRVPEHSHF